MLKFFCGAVFSFSTAKRFLYGNMMRSFRPFLLPILLLLSGAAYAQGGSSILTRAESGDYVVDRTIRRSGVPAQDMYRRGKSWLTGSFGVSARSLPADSLITDSLATRVSISLPDVEDMKNARVRFRVVMYATEGVLVMRADRFVYSATDAVDGERYVLPFAQLGRYFEGTTMPETHNRFDDRMGPIIARFDMMGE